MRSLQVGTALAVTTGIASSVPSRCAVSDSVKSPLIPPNA